MIHRAARDNLIRRVRRMAAKARSSVRSPGVTRRLQILEGRQVLKSALALSR